MMVRMVEFLAGDGVYPVDETRATALSGALLLKARGELGAEGRAGALALHRAIEDRLIEATNTPIPLDGAAAEAAYHILDVSLDAGDRDNPAFALYWAVKEIHQRQQAGGWVEPLYCVECGRPSDEDESTHEWYVERGRGLTSRTCPECWRGTRRREEE